jgi:AcrR family transcriptional regulator
MATTPKAGESKRQPKQTRAQKTVEKLLDATAELLTEKGFEGVNTNAVAGAANVNISTLYSYFPNKKALLEQLLQRLNERQIAMVLEELSTNPERSERMAHILDLILEMRLEQPWMLALNQALNASPELRSIQDNANQQLLEMVEKQVPQNIGGPQASGPQLKAILQLLLEVISSGIQLAAHEDKRQRKKIMAELKLIVNSYLDHYR